MVEVTLGRCQTILHENETIIPKMDTMVTKWQNKKRRKTSGHHGLFLSC
jgi:hypothetical protein